MDIEFEDWLEENGFQLQEEERRALEEGTGKIDGKRSRG